MPHGQTIAFEIVRVLLERGRFCAIARIEAVDFVRTIRARRMAWRRKHPERFSFLDWTPRPGRRIGGIRRFYCRTSPATSTRPLFPYVAFVHVLNKNPDKSKEGKTAPFIVFRTREEGESFLGPIPARWWSPQEFLKSIRGKALRVWLNETLLSFELARHGFVPSPWHSRAYAMSRFASLPPKVRRAALESHQRWADLAGAGRKDLVYIPPEYFPIPDLHRADREWPLGVSPNWFDLYRCRNAGGVWRLWFHSAVVGNRSTKIVPIPRYIHPHPYPRYRGANRIRPERLIRWLMFEILIWFWFDQRPFRFLDIDTMPETKGDFRRVRRALEKLFSNRRIPRSRSLVRSLAHVAMAVARRLSVLGSDGERPPEKISLEDQKAWHQEAEWMIHTLLRHRPGTPEKALGQLARAIGSAAEWRWKIRRMANVSRTGGSCPSTTGPFPVVPSSQGKSRIQKGSGSVGWSSVIRKPARSRNRFVSPAEWRITCFWYMTPENRTRSFLEPSDGM